MNELSSGLLSTLLSLLLGVTPWWYCEGGDVGGGGGGGLVRPAEGHDRPPSAEHHRPVRERRDSTESTAVSPAGGGWGLSRANGRAGWSAHTAPCLRLAGPPIAKSRVAHEEHAQRQRGRVRVGRVDCPRCRRKHPNTRQSAVRTCELSASCGSKFEGDTGNRRREIDLGAVGAATNRGAPQRQPPINERALPRGERRAASSSDRVHAKHPRTPRSEVCKLRAQSHEVYRHTHRAHADLQWHI
eukprot:1874802-Prymnesium_polylepis.2